MSSPVDKRYFRRALVRCDRCRAEYEVRWPGAVKVLSDGTRDFQPLEDWAMQTICPVCRRRNRWYWLRWLGPVSEVTRRG